MAANHYCPNCERSTSSAEARKADYICGFCGTQLEREDRGAWTNVARMSSLAEAGFLVDELAGDGIEARIYQAQDFNALTDRRSISYLIQSSPRVAQDVAARIRQHLAEADARRADADELSGDSDDSSVDPVFWRPVAVVVLAGVASFALGQRFGHDRGELNPPPRNSLAGAVSAIGRPLVTEPAPGLPRHRLSYQWRDQTWILDTDADADGVYESHQRFQSSGAGW
jgi:hypothetical protein